MNITDLKNESKELNKKLYEYVRQVIREIQTYNKMTDKEIADFLKLDVKTLNMILTTDINNLVELYFIPINVISDIIVLSCNGINFNFNTMFDYEPKHTVQEIKQYISDKHLKYKQEKLEELADLLGIDLDNTEEVENLIRKLKEIKQGDN
jgi:hypothetical protein